MKRRTEKRMGWIVAVLLILQIAMVIGWFVLRPRYSDLFEDGALKLNTEAAPGTSLPNAHAHQSGSSLRVHGRIVAGAASTAEQDGTVLVVVLAPEGSELGQARHEYHLSSKLPRGGGSFSVELLIVPPIGSVVRISWGPVTKE